MKGTELVSGTCCRLLHQPDENLRCCMLDVEQSSEMCVELIFWIDTIPDFGEKGPDFRSVFGIAVPNRYSR